jgi:hypothetical protein
LAKRPDLEERRAHDDAERLGLTAEGDDAAVVGREDDNGNLRKLGPEGALATRVEAVAVMDIRAAGCPRNAPTWRDQPAGGLGPAPCRGSYGSAPAGAGARRRSLDGASRRAASPRWSGRAGSLQPHMAILVSTRLGRRDDLGFP